MIWITICEKTVSRLDCFSIIKIIHKDVILGNKIMTDYLSDLEIAQAAIKKPITDIAKKLDIKELGLIPYGNDKAKLTYEFIDGIQDKKDGHLILVTAISPTPAGEGKTTTSVGLVDGLCHIGKRAMICLREPSLGPCFGMKGGAAGGGYAQVIPMTDINLHFTGDFHAIGAAHNLLSALIDNHIHWKIRWTLIQGELLGSELSI